MSEWALVLSCEHGGNRIPARWAGLFSSARARALLRSHRGWDPGALELARLVARALHARLIACTTSRLLADANRPEGHPGLFSRYTRALSGDEKHALLRAAHQPHWRAVEGAARGAIRRRGRVLHLSLHSFTPVLGGVARGCELGLLFDPRRPRERALCGRWQPLLEARLSGLRIRRNYPYRGNAAALTTSLRRVFAPDRYLGIELELNQGYWLRRSRAERGALAAEIAQTLSRAVAQVR